MEEEYRESLKTIEKSLEELNLNNYIYGNILDNLQEQRDPLRAEFLGGNLIKDIKKFFIKDKEKLRVLFEEYKKITESFIQEQTIEYNKERKRYGLEVNCYFPLEGVLEKTLKGLKEIVYTELAKAGTGRINFVN